MRKPIIAGNHKMNLTPTQTAALLRDLKAATKATTGVQTVVFPPFTSLVVANEIVANSPIELGAQNIHQAPKGAYTGEISAAMIAEVGCQWVICGHSERRQLFGESNVVVRDKVRAAIEAGLSPILCVGETLDERNAARTKEVLRDQLSGSLSGLAANELQNLVIAYEPVWAIGTGMTATPSDAENGCCYLRSVLGELYGSNLALSTRILYGGSVKPNNIVTLMAEENIDGALVGGASLTSEAFSAIVNYHE